MESMTFTNWVIEVEDGSRNIYHIHSAECADLKASKYRHAETYPYEPGTSMEKIAGDTFPDQIVDGCMTAVEAIAEFKIFPCAK